MTDKEEAEPSPDVVGMAQATQARVEAELDEFEAEIRRLLKIRD